MNLHIEHEIPASLLRVEAAVLNPALLRRLPTRTPLIVRAEQRSRREFGGRVEREALYVATEAPPPLHLVIPRAWSSWIERTCWDLRAHAATFSIEPQIPPSLRRRFTCEGSYALHAAGDRRTRREITGTLRIDAPVLGRRVEAALVPVITRQFAVEAALLAELAAGSA